MADDKKALTEVLRRAGYSHAVISAAWPSWWTDEASASASGRAELRFALARRLGLEARQLLGERVEFIWNDEARFKHLSAEQEADKAALSSYGISLARILVNATASPKISIENVAALRQAILARAAFVDLQSLIATCWAVGIPVIHLRVFPLDTKSMHAMIAKVEGRFAIMLGRDASYPAPVAFTLAHELGHAILRHLDNAPAVVDMEEADPSDTDMEERQADEFALTLLTGSPEPKIETNIDNFTARALANAVLEAGPKNGIEPGTLALCLAYRRKEWKTAIAALKFIYSDAKPVWQEINKIAQQQLEWEHLSEESAAYLHNVMSA